MNQIKYVLDACLILMMALMGIFLYTTFPESGIVGKTESIETVSSSNSAVAVSKGQMIFKQNCASCHAMDNIINGPALRGVGQRGPWAEDVNNLKNWIKNPGGFITKSKYAQELKLKYRYPMPKQDHLSDADIEEVIRYITSQ